MRMIVNMLIIVYIILGDYAHDYDSYYLATKNVTQLLQ